MNTSIYDDCLPVFKALACETRLEILRMLIERPMNQQELATALGVSPAITSGHVRQLCEAGLVFVVGGEAGRGRQKLCYISENEVLLKIGKPNDDKIITYSMPIGLYTKHRATPSCGLTTKERIIGKFDDESAFWDPKRTEAELVWFSSGYLEYSVPLNQNDSKIKKLTCSFEIGSEYPGFRTIRPSEISFSINRINIGSWISPGNFGDRRGRHTPLWWPVGYSQYGLLKTISVDDTGSYIDGEKMSDVTISELNLNDAKFTIRFSSQEDASPMGGMTIFGKSFGDYNQDILITTYYE